MAPSRNLKSAWALIQLCPFNYANLYIYAQAESQSASEQFIQVSESLKDMVPRIRAAALRDNLNIRDFVVTKEVILTSESEICTFVQGYHIEMYGSILAAPKLDSVKCYVK